MEKERIRRAHKVENDLHTRTVCARANGVKITEKERRKYAKPKEEKESASERASKHALCVGVKPKHPYFVLRERKKGVNYRFRI